MSEYEKLIWSYRWSKFKLIVFYVGMVVIVIGAICNLLTLVMMVIDA